MELGLEGRRALVTGGSLGIGRATALRLSREGARVAIAARGRAALDEAATDIEACSGRRPLAIQADCTRPDDVAAMVRRAGAELGGLDILVNSVGAARGGHFLDLSDDDWAESLASRLMGEVRCCREALPLLRADGGGVIVNVIGHRGKQPESRALPAGVTNAGLINFTVGLAQEEARHGVRVVGVNPGPSTRGASRASSRRRRGSSASRWRPRASAGSRTCRSGAWPGPKRSPTSSCSWRPTGRASSRGP